MAQYIPKEPLLAEIKRLDALYHTSKDLSGDLFIQGLFCFLDTFEVKGVDLYNNGWVDCTKQMPPETKQTSDALQGHREWTESDMVLVWDSMYGCSVDVTKNGKWMSEQRGGYTGQLVHGIIAWRHIPEFSEELLLKAQKGENNG